MKIKHYRESLKMTQCELADFLGVKRSSVSMWETGKTYPSVPALIKMSDKFNCTIDELVKGG